MRETRPPAYVNFACGFTAPCQRQAQPHAVHAWATRRLTAHLCISRAFSMHMLCRVHRMQSKGMLNTRLCLSQARPRRAYLDQTRVYQGRVTLFQVDAHAEISMLHQCKGLQEFAELRAVI